MEMDKTSRRAFFKALARSSAVLAFSGMLAGCRQKQKRPNILFCISDDQSYPHAGAYGCRFVRTPAFDRVAREGILFQRCFVSTPSCCPSRASILSGQEFYRLRETSMNHTVWPGGIPVYPDLFAEQGYHVGFTGKGWGPGNWKTSGRTTNPAGRAYNTVRNAAWAKGMGDIDYAENFKAFLSEKPEGASFCFWYGGNEPHRIYEQGSAIKRGGKLETVDVPGFLPDTKEVRSDILDYALEIEWFDRHLGAMLRLLEERGELGNTVVVVTSDNGMPFPRAKATLYDYGTRMPLAVWWGEKIQPGRVVNDFIRFADFAPTFLEAAGIPIPGEMTGRSLMPLLLSDRSGQVDAGRDRAVFGLERHFPGSRPKGAGYPVRGIRTETYLYIQNRSPDQNPSGDHPGPVWPDDDPTGGFGDTDGSPTKTFLYQHRDTFPELFRLAFGKRPSEELYDVNRDPYELKNLAEDPNYAAVKKDLAVKLHAFLVQTGDPRETGHEELFDKIMKQYPTVGSGR